MRLSRPVLCVLANMSDEERINADPEPSAEQKREKIKEVRTYAYRVNAHAKFLGT
jgi:hypothetical protein